MIIEEYIIDCHFDKSQMATACICVQCSDNSVIKMLYSSELALGEAYYSYSILKKKEQY